MAMQTHARLIAVVLGAVGVAACGGESAGSGDTEGSGGMTSTATTQMQGTSGGSSSAVVSGGALQCRVLSQAWTLAASSLQQTMAPLS